jgi:hypothetical protein
MARRLHHFIGENYQRETSSMNPDYSTIDPQTASPSLDLSASRLFMSWLAEQRISLAFTTY